MSKEFSHGDKRHTIIKIIERSICKYAGETAAHFDEICEEIAKAVDTELFRARAHYRGLVRLGRISGCAPSTVLWPTVARVRRERVAEVKRGGNPENLKKIKKAAAKMAADGVPHIKAPSEPETV